MNHMFPDEEPEDVADAVGGDEAAPQGPTLEQLLSAFAQLHPELEADLKFHLGDLGDSPDPFEYFTAMLDFCADHDIDPEQLTIALDLPPSWHDVDAARKARQNVRDAVEKAETNRLRPLYVSVCKTLLSDAQADIIQRTDAFPRLDGEEESIEFRIRRMVLYWLVESLFEKFVGENPTAFDGMSKDKTRKAKNAKREELRPEAESKLDAALAELA